ncbi:MAG TPA: response regulator [Casimicrobiaceae bacterium]|nr:response regulator [Casimicrobiaceae bacterium]
MTSAGQCIAVIDDEVQVRTALGRLLRLADYEVAAFGSGEEFLASLMTRRPDCAILDVHMPGLSGFDVKARMCAARFEIPVVFITASDDIALDRAVCEAGGVTLLRKPFSNDALLDAVGTALRSNSRGVS